jgi:hypothetical protein
LKTPRAYSLHERHTQSLFAYSKQFRDRHYDYSGGNGGLLYSYYVQTTAKKFVSDKFLTDSMSYFPNEINKKKQQLTTLVHAGACCAGEQIYQYNSSGKWKQISHKY